MPITNDPFLSLRHSALDGASEASRPVSNHNGTNGFSQNLPYHSSAFAASSSSLNVGQSNHNNAHSTLVYANASEHWRGQANGNNNSAPCTLDDDFLKLSRPQPDVLLLHSSQQQQMLEKAKALPSLQRDDEIILQVLSIGLNPVDYKGPEHDYGQPTSPWVHGRDFAGLVVRAPRKLSRVQSGDVVFGPATDFRDIREAAFQEYLITTDHNVARIPKGMAIKTGAAAGISFVAAAIGLGVSLGIDFRSPAFAAPMGPDLYQMVRTIDPTQFPDDVRAEVFDSMPYDERPTRGDWIVIWGGATMTGIIALQLAKLAGLRVIAVADVAKDGKRLINCGADMLADRVDHVRALDVIRTITNNQLRFAIDAIGQESATHLQGLLHTSSADKRAHLLGFTGLPHTKLIDVQQHTAPVKIFQTAPAIGETLMSWCEELLVAHTLKFPDIDVAEPGLMGLNAAIDKLRIVSTSPHNPVVVPVVETAPAPVIASLPVPVQPTPPPPPPARTPVPTDEFAFANQLNSAPDRMQFAYVVPNVSGGLVTPRYQQRTKWDLAANRAYARTAERVGFEYGLSQSRVMAMGDHGADGQHEPVTFSQALLHSTDRLKLIVAMQPGLTHPAMAAKQLASLDHLVDGRLAVSVVCDGCSQGEATATGQMQLDVVERHRRAREFADCLRGAWSLDRFTHSGDHYRFRDYQLRPRPLALPRRPHPEIFLQADPDRLDARDNAAATADVHILDGPIESIDVLAAQIADVRDRARRQHGRPAPRFALPVLAVVRDTDGLARADMAAVDAVDASPSNATRLVGTRDAVADRLLLLKAAGVDMVSASFLHCDDDVRAFGETVLPLVRNLERQGRGRDRDVEFRIVGGDSWMRRPAALSK